MRLYSGFQAERRKGAEGKWNLVVNFLNNMAEVHGNRMHALICNGMLLLDEF